MLDPRLPEASFTLGVVLWQTGRAAAEAKAPFRRRFAARADYAEAHYMLGLVRKQEGDRDGALAGSARPCACARSTPKRRRPWASCWPRAGDAAGAKAALEAAERLTGETADAQAAAFALAAGQASAPAGRSRGGARQRCGTR